jgi:hypothetical protein
MVARKYTFVFLSLLSAMPIYAGEPSQSKDIPEDAQQWNQKKQEWLSFEGILIQTDPLTLKSLNGEIRAFLPAVPSAANAVPGDLVAVTYEPAVSNSSGVRWKQIVVEGHTITGTIREIAADKSGLVIRTHSPDKQEDEINISLQTGLEFRPLVSAMRPGDGINATYVRKTNNISSPEINFVKALEWQSTPVDRPTRWWSLIFAGVALWVLAYLFTMGKPTDLYLGKDGRYSSSQFQTVLWFWIVISAYIAIVFHRITGAGWSYVGGVDIPQNLLILSGISVLTFASAKAITVGKVEKGQVRQTPAEEPKARDLISDDIGRTDLGDFQMIVITFLAVIIYAISVVEFMERIEFRRVVTMPDVDATLLAIFGLGQAAYLGKKAAGDQVLPGSSSPKSGASTMDTVKGPQDEAKQ